MMKKWYQLVGVSVVLVVIGLVLIGVGISKGGETSASFGELFERRNSREEQIKGFEVDKLIEPFDYLDINVEVAAIKIIKGNEYRVHIPAANNKISYEIQNSRLIIKQKEYRKVGLGFIGISLPNKAIRQSLEDIIIYIPENAEIKNIDLECGVGEVEINQVKAEDINIKVGVGTLKMDEVLAETCHIKGGVGEVEIKRLTAHILEVEAGVGQMNIEGQFKSNVTLNGGIGEITLRTKGLESDFNYKLEKGLGEIKLNNKKMSNMKRSSDKVNKTIQASSGIGSIDIYVE